jgi:hypothetical protein
MTIFADLLYRQSLAVFGVPATFQPDHGAPFDITAIDRTSGVEVADNTIGITTIRPAADVLAADLDALGITAADLDGAALTMNGTKWRVSGVMERPTPFGAADGMVTLLLVGNV